MILAGFLAHERTSVISTENWPCMLRFPTSRRGHDARVSRASLIRRCAPPSPAGGRRELVVRARRDSVARFPHPALRATFSRRREKGTCCSGTTPECRALPSSGAARHLLPQAGEGNLILGHDAIVSRGSLIRRCAPPSPAGGRRELDVRARRQSVARFPHPALRATFSRKREKGYVPRCGADPPQPYTAAGINVSAICST